MSLRGFRRTFKPLEVLTQEQVEDVKRGVLAVLQNTGLRFESKMALELFQKNDCLVDSREMRVRVPPGVVEECLRRTPSSFYFRSRNPAHDLVIGGNTTYFCAFPGMNTVDLDTWEPRRATRGENRDALIVLDALENLHFLTPYTPYFGFDDTPPVMAIPESAAAKIRYTTKLQFSGYQKDCEVFTIEMAQAAGTEIQGMMENSPPLTYYEDAVMSAYRFAQAGLPLHITSGAVMGGTSPATIAGTLVTSIAEIVGGIVFVQLVRPGTRVVANAFVFPQNMMTGAPFFGSVGISLHEAAFNQVWRSYGIPVQSSAIGPTNSKMIDYQNCYEKAIPALVAALSGAHIIQFHGGVYGEITHHPVQSIMDDDVAGVIGRFIAGVEVSDDTLALDLINQIGPIPGYYLHTAHTREWWKHEQFVPKVADLVPYGQWQKEGSKSALDRAKAKLCDVLQTHCPMALSDEQEKDIRRILEKARKHYAQRGLL
ncbi:MAG: trimethylamine methyltransferase family protein [Spirochaetales bacterium]|nr:trimethylamine methyltransferase family protein [Spirochaetales bacterium]